MPKATKKTAGSKSMPKWKPAPSPLVRLFEKAMMSIPEAKTRMTFGYPSATVNGNMFTGLHQDSLILRLSPQDRAELNRVGGKAFEPMPGRPMREFVVVPEAILKSEPDLSDWLERAFGYTKLLPPKPGKARSKKTT